MPTKRIAVELDTDDQLSYIPQVQHLIEKLGFTSELLSSDRIISGELFNFDAVIFPGGFGSFYGLREYEGFAEAIRYFVANGGGYLGVCGGAYIAGLRMSPSLYSYCPGTLGLIDAKIISPPWIRYISEYREAAGKRVAVICKITDHPHPIIIPNQGQIIDIVYSAGPLIRELGPEVTPLLTYVDNLMPPGDVAMCCSTFGRGRVIICSPHPETPWGEELVNTGCQEWLYLNMISWVSQPETEATYPFLPWEVKKRLVGYPIIPTVGALLIGTTATLGLMKLVKGRP